MRKMKILASLIFPFAVILLLPSCASKEVTKDNTPQKDSVYVFDQVSTDTVKKELPPPVENPTVQTPYYLVQIGAFSTRENAESFSAIAKKKLNYDMTIKYNVEKNKFVVQLNPPFTSRSEAEKVRNDIKQYQEYNDAWIVTVDK